MYKKMIERVNQLLFSRVTSGVRKTRVIEYRYDEAVRIISAVSHRNVDMYLLAIKSFMLNFGYGSIEVVNDGSLTDDDQALLLEHIPRLHISEASEIDTHSCPSYISWKGLFRIQELARKSFVIKLDADTISLGPLVDVHTAAFENRGFLIGNPRWPVAVDTVFLKDVVSQWQSNQVQALAEQHFYKMHFFENDVRYIRACAGFAGFPRGFATVDEICSLSKEIEHAIGDVWFGWGSEQTAVLCLISKTQDPFVLPWPHYQNYGFPFYSGNLESMNLVHFVGTNRFVDNSYKRLASGMIKRLC